MKYKGKVYAPRLDIEITRDEIENLSEEEYIGLLWTEVKK